MNNSTSKGGSGRRPSMSTATAKDRSDNSTAATDTTAKSTGIKLSEKELDDCQLLLGLRGMLKKEDADNEISKLSENQLAFCEQQMNNCSLKTYLVDGVTSDDGQDDVHSVSDDKDDNNKMNNELSHPPQAQQEEAGALALLAMNNSTKPSLPRSCLKSTLSTSTNKGRISWSEVERTVIMFDHPQNQRCMSLEQMHMNFNEKTCQIGKEIGLEVRERDLEALQFEELQFPEDASERNKQVEIERSATNVKRRFLETNKVDKLPPHLEEQFRRCRLDVWHSSGPTVQMLETFIASCADREMVAVALAEMVAAARAAKLHDEELFKQPPPEEDCLICFLRIPTLHSGSKYFACCGKIICSGCSFAPVYDNQGNIIDEKKCAFCRTPLPITDEEIVDRTMKRVEAGDAEAVYLVGNYYRDGSNGFLQDYIKALERWHRAAELGNTKAYTNIGYAYKHGQGVDVDWKKATYYYELAAMAGKAVARHNLGNNEGRAGNYNRALKHFMIAARDGYSDSLKKIQEMYSNGYATKEDYMTALRSYQAYLGEIKSLQRDKAAVAHERNRYF